MQIVKPPSDVKGLAVAVSGGADSMALLHMLWAAYPVLHAITVDHGLRPESADEAAQVGRWIAQWPGVRHTILKWDGDKPKSGIPSSARAARYALMARHCFEHGLSHLALAHHADDQAETFFMRLVRGSGLDGLAAMREYTPYDPHLTLWRPLLKNASHDDLVSYCRDHDISWVEDPSNASMNYTRNRLRVALKSEGLSEKRLNTTLRRLERASDALRVLADRLYAEALVDRGQDAVTFRLDVLRGQPFELTVRVLRRAMESLHPDDYGPRFEKLEELAQSALESKANFSATLGGCLVRAYPRRQTLVIARETAKNPAKSLPLRVKSL